MPSFATLFSGGELFGVGVRAAGLDHAWGLELDPEIAAVAQANGFSVKVADVLKVAPKSLPRVDWLHASPPCPNFSQAKAHKQETPVDEALGRRTAHFVKVLRPKVFTLENVWGYRNSRSFRLVLSALWNAGYAIEWDHLNAADYGVPQSRRRLWLRAALDEELPPLPNRALQVGWYAAVEDLLDDLPESHFASWQLARIDPDIARAFILPGGGNTNLAEAAPGRGVRFADESMHTVSPVTLAGGSMPRAFIVDGFNSGRKMTVRSAGETVTGTNKGDWRAWLSFGRVVSMTPRALARFQSVPDSYALPGSRALACRVIGNGVPCLLARRLADSFQSLFD